MKLNKTLCYLIGILAIAFNCHAGENMIKNSQLNMNPGSTGPTDWTNDKSTKQLITKNILATLDQAIEIKVEEARKGDGYMYQVITPKSGFTKTGLLLQGYLKTNKKSGVFLQIKRFKGKKLLRIINLYGTSVGNWQLVKKVIPLEGANKVHILCRYKQSESFVGNKVWFADISLTEVDAKIKKDDFANKKLKSLYLAIQLFRPTLTAPCSQAGDRSSRITSILKLSEFIIMPFPVVVPKPLLNRGG